jgi:integrase
LTPALASALAELLEGDVPVDPEALVFRSPRGQVLRHKAFHARCWRPGLAKAQLPPIPMHSLRHSAAAALIQAGATPKEVQAVLGHRSAAFTLTVYGHLFDADLDSLADRLGARVSDLTRDIRGIAVIGEVG